MNQNYAAIFLCAVGSLGLGSAQSANQTKPAAPAPPPTSPCHPPAEVENISDGTKAALACEWIDPAAVLHTLKALQFYTIPIPKAGGGYLDSVQAAQQALQELIAGAAGNEDIYRAALGQPDALGRPDAQGISAFLEMLANANTTNSKKPDNESALYKETDERFKQAEALIADIFKSSTGKQALAKINASFGRKDNYVALFQLLDAYPKFGANASDDDKTKYAKKLEILRAAYSMKADRLASLVAGKVAPSKQ